MSRLRVHLPVIMLSIFSQAFIIITIDPKRFESRLCAKQMEELLILSSFMPGCFVGEPIYVARKQLNGDAPSANGKGSFQAEDDG